MNYLPQYKVGSPIFRTLAEIRHRKECVRAQFYSSSPPPKSIQTLNEFRTKNPSRGEYLLHETAHTISLNPPHQILPRAFVPFINKTNQLDFPESFFFKQQGASVLGDGSCLLDNETLLADVTIDFHRHPKSHHLLSKNIPKTTQIGGTLAVIASPGSQNYFHWTLCALPRLLALHSSGIQTDFYYINTQHAFHREWLKKMEIPQEKLIPSSASDHFKPDELLIPSFMGTADLPALSSIQHLRKFMPFSSTKTPERIFISRAGSRRRKLLNEAEIESFLMTQGFSTIQPGELSVEQQMRLFSQAKVIVSPHGAELTNLIYCSPETQLIELFSPRYLNPCFRELSALCKLDYSAVIGEGGDAVLKKGREMHWVWSNLKIDLNLLKKALI